MVLFLTQDSKQTLSDLNLINENNRLTYAALILLGKKEVITKKLPQTKVSLEFRNAPAQITFDNRVFFEEPYFISVEKIWDSINLRNGKVSVQQGPFIFDIPYFNEEVIREALNNAITHRDYTRSSEILIKLYPQAMNIVNPGGFPIGANLKNLLYVSSTPRNRLLADVLSKTGLVERSGQGVDKIFYQSITEAKGKPDYTHSDDFQVELRLSALVKDKAFALFIKQLQKDRKRDNKLSVQEIITLENIREGKNKKLDKRIVNKLEEEGLIEKIGKTSEQTIILSKLYYSYTNREADYTKIMPIDEDFIIMRITQHLSKWKTAKMGNFVDLFKGQLTREQVKNYIYGLSDMGILNYKGKGPRRVYTLNKDKTERNKIVHRAIEIGLEQMRKTGELNLENNKKRTSKEKPDQN